MEVLRAGLVVAAAVLVGARAADVDGLVPLSVPPSQFL